MIPDVYRFEILKLRAGDWSLMLLKNERLIGGFVGSDFEDLQLAGKNWLQASSKQKPIARPPGEL